MFLKQPTELTTAEQETYQGETCLRKMPGLSICIKEQLLLKLMVNLVPFSHPRWIGRGKNYSLPSSYFLCHLKSQTQVDTIEEKGGKKGKMDCFFLAGC